MNATTTSTTYTPPTDLPANVGLDWRVNANGTNGPSLWSGATFTTANPPSTPALRASANNGLALTYTPRLDWTNSWVPDGIDFDHYHLELATNSGFASPEEIDISGGSSSSEYTIPLDKSLIPNTRYYWRVQAYNTVRQYSSWSAVRKFRTAILPPNLVAPLNGDPVATRRPVFDWDDVEGASGYRIQISRTPTFGTVLMQARVTPSTFTPGMNLPAGMTLYWRVQAIGTNGPSLWSELWQFTTP